MPDSPHRAFRLIMLALAATLAGCDLFGLDDPSIEGALHDRLVTDGGSPFGIAISKDGEVIVTLLNDTRVARFEVGDAEISTYQTLGPDPFDVAFTIDQSQAYVTRLANDVVHRILMPPLSGNASFTAGSQNLRLLAAEDGTSLLLLGNDGRVRRVSRATGARLDSTVLLGEPAMAIHRRTGDGMLAVVAGATVYLLDPATLDVLDSRGLGASVHDVLFMPGGDRLLVACEDQGKIMLLDAHTLATIDSLQDTTAQFLPYAMRLSPDKKTLLVTSTNSSHVVIVDAESFAIRRRVLTGGAPRRIAFTPDGRFAFVTNESGWIDVIR